MTRMEPVNGTRSPILRRGGIGASLGLAALVAIPASTQANGFGGDCSAGPCVWRNDNPVFWWSDSMNQNWRDAGNYAKGRLDLSNVDPTSVANVENSDVRVHQGSYGGTWVGLTQCFEVNDQKSCKRANVYANNSGHSFTQDERESTLCHEFGHVVGLHHYANHQPSDTCMETPHWHRDYDSHDRGHLNGHYN